MVFTTGPSCALKVSSPGTRSDHAAACEIDLGPAERGIIHCHLGQVYTVVFMMGRKMAPCVLERGGR